MEVCARPNSGLEKVLPELKQMSSKTGSGKATCGQYATFCQFEGGQGECVSL